MKNKKVSEFARVTAMTAAELARETARFEGSAKAVDAPVRERRKVGKFYRRVGRPKFGRAGTKMVAVSVEKRLLAQFDRVAKRTKTKRSEVVAKAMREFVAAAGRG